MQPRADPVGFCPIVDEGLLEPLMLQGLLGRDAVLRVIDEDLLQEVEELAIIWGIGRDELLP